MRIIKGKGISKGVVNGTDDFYQCGAVTIFTAAAGNIETERRRFGKGVDDNVC